MYEVDCDNAFCKLRTTSERTLERTGGECTTKHSVTGIWVLIQCELMQNDKHFMCLSLIQHIPHTTNFEKLLKLVVSHGGENLEIIL